MPTKDTFVLIVFNMWDVMNRHSLTIHFYSQVGCESDLVLCKWFFQTEVSFVLRELFPAEVQPETESTVDVVRVCAAANRI